MNGIEHFRAAASYCSPASCPGMIVSVDQLRAATGPTCKLTQFATAKIRSGLPSHDERPQVAHIAAYFGEQAA